VPFCRHRRPPFNWLPDTLVFIGGGQSSGLEREDYVVVGHFSSLEGIGGNTVKAEKQYQAEQQCVLALELVFGVEMHVVFTLDLTEVRWIAVTDQSFGLSHHVIPGPTNACLRLRLILQPFQLVLCPLLPGFRFFKLGIDLSYFHVLLL